jgi:hypothetical protein
MMVYGLTLENTAPKQRLKTHLAAAVLNLLWFTAVMALVFTAVSPVYSRKRSIDTALDSHYGINPRSAGSAAKWSATSESTIIACHIFAGFEL